jgi:hypothetical protein
LRARERQTHHHCLLWKAAISGSFVFVAPGPNSVGQDKEKGLGININSNLELKNTMLGVVMHACDPITQEPKTGRSPTPGQPGLHNRQPVKKTKTKTKTKIGLVE